MGKVFMVQPSAFTDQLTEDGHQLTKLPYPFFVDEEGMVGRQDVFKGTVYQVIGFAKDLAVHKIDLEWEEAMQDPSLAVGAYLVTSDEEGNWSTHQTAVSKMELLSEGGE